MCKNIFQIFRGWILNFKGFKISNGDISVDVQYRYINYILLYIIIIIYIVYYINLRYVNMKSLQTITKPKFDQKYVFVNGI